MSALTATFGEPTTIDTLSTDDAESAAGVVEVTNKAQHLFQQPVYITREAWDDCVAWTEDDTRRTGAHQDPDERLQKVLWRTKVAVNSIANSDLEQVEFPLRRISTEPCLRAWLSQMHLPLEVNATCPWPWSHAITNDTCTRCGAHPYTLVDTDIVLPRADLKVVHSHNDDDQPVLVISLATEG
ncbi:hypothetical protein ACFVBP_10370 [Nocardioides sp. NPDC057764]|uniref:hypothetical protein n=1 Tax=Nocardioides sp. NPDC057764 TaxID=3346243 RepID=UPI00366D2903